MEHPTATGSNTASAASSSRQAEDHASQPGGMGDSNRGDHGDEKAVGTVLDQAVVSPDSKPSEKIRVTITSPKAPPFG